MYRKSMEDIRHMIRDIPYPAKLPAEIAHLHYYVLDAGHSIVCVPRTFLPFITAYNTADFEVPIPVKYVLEKGWEKIPGTDSVSVDVPYNDMLGVVLPDGYDEF